MSRPDATGGMVTELDPLGANVGRESASSDLTPAEMMFIGQNAHYGSRAGDPTNLQSGCSVNGMELPCEVFLRMAGDGVLGLRANDPRGPGTVERPLQGMGGGGAVWVDTSEETAALGSDEISDNPDGGAVNLTVSARLSGYFVHLPVGAAPSGPAATTLTPQNPTPTPAPTPQTPIWCQPDVIKAMNRAWARTTNGMSGNEAGFVLNGTPSKYSIVDTKSGNTKNEQKMTIYGDTFLLFHVHPNSSTRNPSTPENNARGDRKSGDTTISDRFQSQQPPRTILFLVGHRTGLTMYDPRTKKKYRFT